MASKDHIPDYQQFPSEFLSDGDIYQIFSTNKLMMGRMISGSKSGYYDEYPDNLIVFNANVVIESRGKIWHGDLDVTRDMENLEKIAETLEEPLYILREMDARFENEDAGVKFWKTRAVAVIGKQT
jgi:hypothetical protein